MIEVLQEEADKLVGIQFTDIYEQTYVFKDGAILIVRPSRKKVIAVEQPEPPVLP